MRIFIVYKLWRKLFLFLGKLLTHDLYQQKHLRLESSSFFVLFIFQLLFLAGEVFRQILVSHTVAATLGLERGGKRRRWRLNLKNTAKNFSNRKYQIIYCANQISNNQFYWLPPIFFPVTLLASSSHCNSQSGTAGGWINSPKKKEMDS